MTNSATDQTRIIFGGDVYVGERRVGIDPALQALAKAADHVCINLEGPVLDMDGLSDREPDTPLYSNPSVMDLLASLNTTLATTANNHITDWQDEGFEQTIAKLGEASIAWFGVGRDDEQAARPKIIQTPDGTVGLLSFGDEVICCDPPIDGHYGCAPMSDVLMQRCVEGLAKEVDIVIVQVHTGLTNYHLPAPETRQLFRSLIDWGADAVIGHHPHVLQGMETYQGKPIYYSLGNLVFAPIFRKRGWMKLSEENRYAMLVELTLSEGKITSWGGQHTCFDLESDTLKLCLNEVDAVRTSRAKKWSGALSTDLKHYTSRYKRYVYVRMLHRLIWRLHPSRWHELDARRLRAMVRGLKQR